MAAIAVHHAIRGQDAIRADETAAKIAVIANGTASKANVARNPAHGIYPSVVIVCPTARQVDEVKARLQSLDA